MNGKIWILSLMRNMNKYLYFFASRLQQTICIADRLFQHGYKIHVINEIFFQMPNDHHKHHMFFMLTNNK